VYLCRNLREMFKIDAADYMVSICGSDALRELSSPGKSGSVFFLSQDDRFMIKTLRKSEVQVFYSAMPCAIFSFPRLIILCFGKYILLDYELVNCMDHMVLVNRNGTSHINHPIFYQIPIC
jgi:hypothetical protein